MNAGGVSRHWAGPVWAGWLRNMEKEEAPWSSLLGMEARLGQLYTLELSESR